MSKRKYVYVRKLEEKILTIQEAGETRQEIADYFGWITGSGIPVYPPAGENRLPAPRNGRIWAQSRNSCRVPGKPVVGHRTERAKDGRVYNAESCGNAV